MVGMPDWERAARHVLVSVLVVACGGPQEPAEDGAACYRDADCRHGLVCVPTSGAARVCSKDVSGLVSTVEGPPPPPDAGADPEGG